MPAPHSSDPQTGWLAFIGAVGVTVGGVFVAIVNKAGDWRQELIKQKTQREVRQEDADAAYTTNLRGDLERLTERFDALTQQRDTEAIERIKQEQKIAHLEIELERMATKIEFLTEQKAHYESEIAGLKTIIADREATIVQLRQQLADALVIGTAETEPPRRLVSRETGGE